MTEGMETEEWLDNEILPQEASQSDTSSSQLLVTSTPKATKKKKKAENFQSEVLKRFDSLDARAIEEDARMRAIDEEILIEERRRTELLQEFVKNSGEMKTAFVAFVNNRSQ